MIEQLGDSNPLPLKLKPSNEQIQRVERGFEAADSLKLTYQGQQHIIEAVSYAERALTETPSTATSSAYGRLASFLRSSDLGFPVQLQPIQPDSWVETPWDRTPPGVDSTTVIPKPEDIRVLIEEADAVLVDSRFREDPKSWDLATQGYMYSPTVGLQRAVGGAVDIGDLPLAEFALERLRVFAERLKSMDLLVESLAYLGVAKIKRGLSITEMEQLSEEVIRDIYSSEDNEAKQAVIHFGLGKES